MSEAAEQDLSTPLVWSIRPCERNWPVAVGVVVVILALSLAVQLEFGGPIWALVTAVLLGAAVLPHYLRTTYTLSDEGVSAKGLVAHTRPWAELRAYFEDADGVLVSPLKSNSRLAYTRGVYIRFSGNRDEVIERVQAYLEASSGESGGDEAASGDTGTG